MYDPGTRRGYIVFLSLMPYPPVIKSQSFSKKGDTYACENHIVHPPKFLWGHL